MEPALAQFCFNNWQSSPLGIFWAPKPKPHVSSTLNQFCINIQLTLPHFELCWDTIELKPPWYLLSIQFYIRIKKSRKKVKMCMIKEKSIWFVLKTMVSIGHIEFDYVLKIYATKMMSKRVWLRINLSMKFILKIK